MHTYIFLYIYLFLFFFFFFSKKRFRFKNMLYFFQSVGLLDVKPGFGPQARHQNEIRKIFLRRLPLSRFLSKTLNVNKIATKSFSKNLSFGVDFKL